VNELLEHIPEVISNAENYDMKWSIEEEEIERVI